MTKFLMVDGGFVIAVDKIAAMECTSMLEGEGEGGGLRGTTIHVDAAEPRTYTFRGLYIEDLMRLLETPCFMLEVHTE